VRHLDLSQSTRVTDRRTDGQNYDSQDRPRICSRGKNHTQDFNGAIGPIFPVFIFESQMAPLQDAACEWAPTLPPLPTATE